MFKMIRKFIRFENIYVYFTICSFISFVLQIKNVSHVPQVYRSAVGMNQQIRSNNRLSVTLTK